MVSNLTTECREFHAVSNGIWQGDNPIHFALPLLIIQICFVLLVTRAVSFLLKPLRQPRVVGEIIGGILLGPSILGRSTTYLNTLFPKQSITVLEVVADLGLIFFLFMVGLELDLDALLKTGKQAMSIALAGICVPFAGGVGVSVVLMHTISAGVKFTPFLVFMGVAMSITAFPVLARILAERRLLTTDVGRMAMSAAAVNDVVAWILLALAIALSGSDQSPLIALWVLLCGIAYVIAMFILVRPIMAWVARHAIENEPVPELHIAVTLAGVLACSVLTEVIGIHSIFGAFVFGIIIPKEGPFAGVLIEKIEDIVTALMLPLYFASSGLKTDIGSVHGLQSIGILVLVISVACLGKITGTLLVALMHKMNFNKSLTLGFLMNTKGLVELIVLNIGRQRKVLNDETFAIMVLMALFTTFITTPAIVALYKPARNPTPYNRRQLGFENLDKELCIMACVHGTTNVPAITNLLEASRGTRKQAVRLYILHLIELSERSSAIMKIQKERKDGRPFWNRNSSGRDSITVAFEAYGQLTKVKVRPMSAISSFGDMHDEVCTLAADKRAALIIIPYHKHLSQEDGMLESHNPGFRAVNQKIMQHAPCSVALLVHQGIEATIFPSSNLDRNVAVLFFGGPDDREALAFGLRMAEHPGVKLTVFRFLLPPNPSPPPPTQPQPQPPAATSTRATLTSPEITSNSSSPSSQHFVALDMDLTKEAQLDEDCLAMIHRVADNNSHIGNGETSGMSSQLSYEQHVTSDPVSSVIEMVGDKDFHLLLVGQARKPYPAFAAMFDGSHPKEAKELGPIGDALATNGSIIKGSILVIQQHDPTLVHQHDSSKPIVDTTTTTTSTTQQSSTINVVSSS